jgi:pyrroloquinoline quinone biosynthesis protein E
MSIDYVASDYFSERPKACMGGWGRRFLHVIPNGRVLPCHAAGELPGMSFFTIQERPLRDIWLSEAFERYRGTAWMPEPCRSCPQREVDFGGCRCQAFALTGDASRTDPVCDLTADHRILLERVKELESAAQPPVRRPRLNPAGS